MKRYVPQRQQDKPDLALAKSRLRVAAIQAGPSEIIRRHPLSAMIGTAAGAFALTSIFKLFSHGSSSEDAPTDDPSSQKKSSRTRGRSGAWAILQSVVRLGLPIIQSQLTKHFLNRTHEAHQQESYADASGGQENAHAVG